jgi:hypothetical protein
MRGIMNLRTTWVIAAAFFALSAASAEATIIDLFDSGDQSLFVSYRTGKQADSDEVTGVGTVIGGCRDVWLEWMSGASSTAEVVADQEVGLGFYFTQGVGVATTTVVWDKTPSEPLHTVSYSLGENLELGQDRFVLDVATVTDDTMHLKLAVYKDSTHFWYCNVDLPEGTTGAVSVPYTSFIAGGAAGARDFSSVGAIVMQLGGQGYSSSDIRLNSLKTAAPEPSTLGLLAVMGVVFFGLKRRKPAA